MNAVKRMRRRQGFTLTEVMVASSLALIVVGAAYTVFSHASRFTRAGGYQVQFTAMARKASQKITRYVEQGKAVAVSSNALLIMSVDLKAAEVRFQDGDGDPDTVVDNRLIYDSDTGSPGGEVVVCTHVSPLEGEPMFSTIPTSPNAAKLAFHVGDGTNVGHTAFSGTGQGYQGTAVRFSATPRNLQRWYD